MSIDVNVVHVRDPDIESIFVHLVTYTDIYEVFSDSHISFTFAAIFVLSYLWLFKYSFEVVDFLWNRTVDSLKTSFHLLL